MKVTTRWISLVVVFAALYAVGVISLAPISYNIIQVRLADALLPLSMIFGVPSAIGLGLGCIVSNVYGAIGIIDIIGGTTANIIAGTLAWYLARKRNFTYRLLGSFVQTITVTLIVGGYLWLIFEVPVESSLIGVLVGSIIAINIIGFPIQEIIRRSITFKENPT